MVILKNPQNNELNLCNDKTDKNHMLSDKHKFN